MSNKQNIRKTFLLSPSLVQKMKEVQEKLEIKSEVEVVILALRELYEKQFPEIPAYVKIKMGTADRSARTPEEKATEKVDIEAARLDAIERKKKKDQEEKVDNGARICRNMGGTETKDPSGNRKCTYLSYGWLNPYNATATERIRYLDELTDEDEETQYYNAVTKEPMPADQVMAAIHASEEAASQSSTLQKTQ